MYLLTAAQFMAQYKIFNGDSSYVVNKNGFCMDIFRKVMNFERMLLIFSRECSKFNFKIIGDFGFCNLKSLLREI